MLLLRIGELRLLRWRALRLRLMLRKVLPLLLSLLRRRPLLLLLLLLLLHLPDLPLLLLWRLLLLLRVRLQGSRHVLLLLL